MNSSVSYERQGQIALITLSNPPVNALGHAQREGLLCALNEAQRDAVTVVVLLCSGRTFIAGADIREFGKPPQAPSLPDVVNAFEQSLKPIVAVIHGTALGGGLEMALGCHYRIARRDARVGLPEVKLGLLPGAGGTQRLPRLAGVANALNMIVSGAPVSAMQAWEFHIVDELFDGDPRLAGIAFAQRMMDQSLGVRRTGEQTVALHGSDNAALIEAKRAEVAKRQPGFFSPPRCIAAIESATCLPLAEGLQRERALFQECLASEQRAALVHAFFAERQCTQIDDVPKDTAVRTIERVGVIGGGTMGVGIALSIVSAGIAVALLEVNEQTLQRALQRARETCEASVQRGSLNPQEMEKRLALLHGTLDYNELAEADLVIEAVFESLEAKRAVFERLDQVCKPGAILASNTSSLDLDVIAGFTSRTQDVVGLHFFSPANVMRLLEVVRGRFTHPEVLATVMGLSKTLNKVAVVVGVCDGFVGNRMVFQYGREAEFLLEEGATPEQVDAALCRFGLAMGPNAMRDLSGVDISWSIRQRQRQTLPAHYPLPSVLDKLYEAGMLGQKTGKGFYCYAPGSRIPTPNPELIPLLEAVSRAKGIERQVLSDEYIVERCVFALINEGAKILEEGIARRSSDIDVIYLHGYGFAAWRGGPMFYADSLGLDKVLARIREFHQRFGAWWEPAPLLEKLAAQGRSFADWKHDV